MQAEIKIINNKWGEGGVETNSCIMFKNLNYLHVKL